MTSETMSEGVDKQEAMRKFSLVTGPAGEEMLPALEELAPELGRYIVEFGYGEIYGRPGLDLRERQIAAVASLVTQGGAAPQLALHIGGALRVGMTEAEVIEVIVHCLPFVGFPRILNAVATAREVFKSHADAD
jgi:4-carboxymuconolactone decarboxylase